MRTAGHSGMKGWLQGLNGGFYWSALLLTDLPFAVVAAIGGWIGYTVRRAPRTAPPAPPSRSPRPRPSTGRTPG